MLQPNLVQCLGPSANRQDSAKHHSIPTLRFQGKETRLQVIIPQKLKTDKQMGFDF